VSRPIAGAEEVARLFVELNERMASLRLVERIVNGQPGLLAEQEGATVAVYAFDIAGSRIRRIWVVTNPRKLRGWGSGCTT